MIFSLLELRNLLINNDINHDVDVDTNGKLSRVFNIEIFAKDIIKSSVVYKTSDICQWEDGRIIISWKDFIHEALYRFFGNEKIMVYPSIIYPARDKLLKLAKKLKLLDVKKTVNETIKIKSLDRK